jgi:uncharacterized protein with GYD domain
MATFISLVKFTPQGIERVADTTKRAASIKQLAKKHGAKLVNVYWMLGEFDGAIVFEAPDDETATGLMLKVASAGNVTTRTCRAFVAAEMDKILAGGKK